MLLQFTQINFIEEDNMSKKEFIFNEEYINKSHENLRNSEEWTEFIVPLIKSLKDK